MPAASVEREVIEILDSDSDLDSASESQPAGSAAPSGSAPNTPRPALAAGPGNAGVPDDEDVFESISDSLEPSSPQTLSHGSQRQQQLRLQRSQQQQGRQALQALATQPILRIYNRQQQVTGLQRLAGSQPMPPAHNASQGGNLEQQRQEQRAAAAACAARAASRSRSLSLSQRTTPTKAAMSDAQSPAPAGLAGTAAAAAAAAAAAGTTGAGIKAPKSRRSFQSALAAVAEELGAAATAESPQAPLQPGGQPGRAAVATPAATAPTAVGAVASTAAGIARACDAAAGVMGETNHPAGSAAGFAVKQEKGAAAGVALSPVPLSAPAPAKPAAAANVPVAAAEDPASLPCRRINFVAAADAVGTGASAMAASPAAAKGGAGSSLPAHPAAAAAAAGAAATAAEEAATTDEAEGSDTLGDSDTPNADLGTTARAAAVSAATAAGAAAQGDKARAGILSSSPARRSQRSAAITASVAIAAAAAGIESLDPPAAAPSTAAAAAAVAGGGGRGGASPAQHRLAVGTRPLSTAQAQGAAAGVQGAVKASIPAASQQQQQQSLKRKLNLTGHPELSSVHGAAASAGQPVTAHQVAAAALAGGGVASGDHKRQRSGTASGSSNSVQQAAAALARAGRRYLQQKQQQQQQQRSRLQNEQQHVQQQQQQQQQQQRQCQVQQDLSAKYKVWPDLYADSSSSGMFDLIPAGIASAGAFKFMQELQAATTAAAAAAGAGGGKASKAPSKKLHQPQQQNATGSKPRHKRNTRAAVAAAATGGGNAGISNSEAASLNTHSVSEGQGCSCACAGGAADGSCVCAEGGLHSDPETQVLGAPPCTEQSQQQQQQQRSSAAGAAAAAAAAAGDAAADEAQWYQQAEQQCLRFTWQTAPCGRFYRVEVNQRKGTVSLVPYSVVTRDNWLEQLRQLNGRTRVEVVRDPCHPTQFNPIRPAFPPAEGSEQHMLVANQALQKGEQLGLYWGQLVTHMDDVKASQADLSCAYGLKNAYSMPVEWSAELPGDIADGPLVVVGDDSVCRMCLVNDAKSWVQDMDDKGLDPCPQAAAGSCNCHKYAKRKANVEWENYVYRTQRGEYIAVVVAVASRPVKAGQELLASYEESSAEFWDELKGNLQLHTYVSTLQHSGRAKSAALQEALYLARGSQGSNPQHAVQVLQQIQTVLQRALLADAQAENKLSVLQQEAHAWAQGGPMPPDVVAARRGLAGPASAAAAGAGAAAAGGGGGAGGGSGGVSGVGHGAGAKVLPPPAAAAAAAGREAVGGFSFSGSGSTLGSSLQPTLDIQKEQQQQQQQQQQQHDSGFAVQVEPGDEALSPPKPMQGDQMR